MSDAAAPWACLVPHGSHLGGPVELRARRVAVGAGEHCVVRCPGTALRRSADELFTLEHDADGGVYVTRTSDVRVYLNGAAGASEPERGADDVNLGLARGEVCAVLELRPNGRDVPLVRR